MEWINAGASKVHTLSSSIVVFDAEITYKVIVTSYLFPDCKLSLERLQAVSSAVSKEKLVVDVRSGLAVFSSVRVISASPSSCRRRDGKWMVAMNKWQDITDMEVSRGERKSAAAFPRPDPSSDSLDLLSAYCRCFVKSLSPAPS